MKEYFIKFCDGLVYIASKCGICKVEVPDYISITDIENELEDMHRELIEDVEDYGYVNEEKEINVPYLLNHVCDKNKWRWVECDIDVHIMPVG